MKSVLIMQKLTMALVAVLFIGTSLLASTQQAGAQPSWMPNPPKAVAGSKCDIDPLKMRIDHMTVLQHKRNETMRDGIRTDKFSLKRCITCHAVKDDTGKYLTVKDERHFCRSCHDYAAVRIDCFDCHASRPGKKMDKAAKSAPNPHENMASHKGLEGKSSSVGRKADTTFAALQKYSTGEGK